MSKKKGALDISAADESKAKSLKENGLSKKIQLESEVKNDSSSSIYMVAVLGCLVIAVLSFTFGVFTLPVIPFKNDNDGQQR